MNHKIVAVVCFSLILLTTVAFSQTGQAPIHSGNVQYSTNNASGMPRESVPSVPYSGFNSSGQGAYSNPSNPQRQVIPNQQNGAYVPQQQPAGQQYPTRQSQPIGQPYPTQPQPAGQPYPTQPQPAGQPYPTQSQPAGQPYPTQTRPVGQPYPTQPQPAGQPYPTQPQPAGQPYPTQSQPAGQPYPTQSQPAGQPYPTQPIGQPQSNAPFELTPQQQNQVNQVLAFWESYTRGIKKFEADFDLYSYPAVSVGGTDVNSPPQSQHTTGFLKYEAPNKGIFRIDGPPKELYRCNGKSVYTYNFDKKEINEYRYSDGSITGQELKKGPMAFLFGASAATLRDRYWIRLLPLPPGAPQGQIWLEAYPKYQEDLQDMTKAELIINVKPCKPVAFQRYSPNGDRQSYALKNIKVNKFELFGGEPFEPNERGWTVILSSQPE